MRDDEPYIPHAFEKYCTSDWGKSEAMIFSRERVMKWYHAGEINEQEVEILLRVSRVS
jgi:hypothetical protein